MDETFSLHLKKIEKDIFNPFKFSTSEIKRDIFSNVVQEVKEVLYEEICLTKRKERNTEIHFELINIL